jgi:hypothetical protein
MVPSAHVLRGHVGTLLASQVQCVLATVELSCVPTTALMAFAHSEDLRSVYLASHTMARKAENMIERPTAVSLLFDNRTGNLKDHGDGLLVTARGRVVPPSNRTTNDSHEAAPLFLAKNPNMSTFLAGVGVGIFDFQVSEYEVVRVGGGVLEPIDRRGDHIGATHTHTHLHLLPTRTHVLFQSLVSLPLIPHTRTRTHTHTYSLQSYSGGGLRKASIMGAGW